MEKDVESESPVLAWDTDVIVSEDNKKNRKKRECPEVIHIKDNEEIVKPELQPGRKKERKDATLEWDTSVIVDGKIVNEKCSYTEEQIMEAVRLVKEEGYSYGRAERATGIPGSSIYGRMKGKLPHKEAHHSVMIFSPEEERKLAVWLVLFAKRTDKTQRRHLSSEIHKILQKTNRKRPDGTSCKDKPPSKSWMTCFFNRNNLYERIPRCRWKKKAKEPSKSTKEESAAYRDLLKELRRNSHLQNQKGKVKSKNDPKASEKDPKPRQLSDCEIRLREQEAQEVRQIEEEAKMSKASSTFNAEEAPKFASLVTECIKTNNFISKKEVLDIANQILSNSKNCRSEVNGVWVTDFFRELSKVVKCNESKSQFNQLAMSKVIEEIVLIKEDSTTEVVQNFAEQVISNIPQGEVDLVEDDEGNGKASFTFSVEEAQPSTGYRPTPSQTCKNNDTHNDKMSNAQALDHILILASKMGTDKFIRIKSLYHLGKEPEDPEEFLFYKLYARLKNFFENLDSV